MKVCSKTTVTFSDQTPHLLVLSPKWVPREALIFPALAPFGGEGGAHAPGEGVRRAAYFLTDPYRAAPRLMAALLDVITSIKSFQDLVNDLAPSS
jgi:hypothetical protein